MSGAETNPNPIAVTDWAGKVPAIFAECVDARKGTRYVLSRPYDDRGTLYATDRRIAVRCPTPAGWDLPNPVFYPIESLRGCFDAVDCRATPIEVSWSPRPCPRCAGEGALPGRPCGRCKGRGRVVEDGCDCPHCTGEHVEACDTCGGTGSLDAIECPDCDGTRIADHREPVAVGPGYHLGSRYLSLLLRHEARIYLPTAPSLPCRFAVGDDVDGVLMPSMGC